MYKVITFESDGKEYRAELHCDVRKEKALVNVYNRNCDYTIIKAYTINYIETIDGAMVSASDALKEAIETHLYERENYGI